MDISNTHLLPEWLRTFFVGQMTSYKMHKDVDVGYNYFVPHMLDVEHACHTIRKLLVIHATKEL
jgi:hypothetical protein